MSKERHQSSGNTAARLLQATTVCCITRGEWGGGGGGRGTGLLSVARVNFTHAARAGGRPDTEVSGKLREVCVWRGE